MNTEEISFSGAQKPSNLILKKISWKTSSKKVANSDVKTGHCTPNTGHKEKKIGPAEKRTVSGFELPVPSKKRLETLNRKPETDLNSGPTAFLVGSHTRPNILY